MGLFRQVPLGIVVTTNLPLVPRMKARRTASRPPINGIKDSIMSAISINKPINAERDIYQDDFSEDIKVCEALGLTGQLTLLNTKNNKIQTDFAHCKVSKEDYAIWRKFCPGLYSTLIDQRYYYERHISRYIFDSIPPPVLKHWNYIKQNYDFDFFEIRTREATTPYSDPLLFGHLGQDIFLLARWDSESPDMLSFEQVKAIIMKDEAKENTKAMMESLIPILLLGSGIALVACGIISRI